VFPVKRGQPFLFCEHCRRAVGTDPGTAPPPRPQRSECPACGRTLEEGYRYCPYCGQRL
jgi:hypothetical protein